MSRVALLLVIATMLGADIYLFGTWTNRWTASRELEQAAARLPQVPRDFGDWRGTDRELPARDVARAELTGYVYRDYENERTKERFTVLLLCGRAGPLSVHTPDVCYTGLGYRPVTAEARTEVKPLGSDTVSHLWSADFDKERPLNTSKLRIFWGWAPPGGNWDAPANARLAFAGRPALYKLYVVRPMTSANRAAEEPLCQEFLGALLPQLAATLSPAAPPASTEVAR